MLIPELEKEMTRKENYRPLFLKNTNAEIFQQILANWLQQTIKRIIHQDQWDLPQESEGGSPQWNTNGSGYRAQ